ncbi:MAG: ABC transporter permease [Alphaproteobacteria bacterium]|nr:ABC transporter permease [Alphaproteobacteria bacterium SS10]
MGARVSAMVLRHWYLLRGSWPRLIELIYWPLVQLLIWGFLSGFLVDNSSWVAQAAGVLVGAVLLWEVVLRSQLGVTLSFLEEMWSRNLGHLFVSPLHPLEWTTSLVVMSMIRSAIGLVPAFIAAAFLAGFSVFDLGMPMVAFFAALMMMGWWLGILIMGVILRHGLGAESIAWMSLFVLAPFSCVYYPLEALPGWLQPVALAIPATHVFEGMRAIMFGGEVRLDQLAIAIGLNLFYLILAIWLLQRSFAHARKVGKILQMGE